MTGLESAAALGALLGALLLIGAARRWRRGRIGAGALFGGACLLALSAAAIAALLAVGLHGFRRLSAEHVAGEIRFARIAAHEYRADLTLGTGAPRRFLLRGDDWQVDARILKWRAFATVIGFDAVYRLERIGGRYQRIEDERSAPRTVYALNPPNRVDLWDLTRRFGKWLPWVDALYGSATYAPMADGAAYAIEVSPSGLLTRPLDREARHALRGWR
jgi:hypothetical protein